MRDIDDIRRSNLIALEREAGGPSEIAKIVGMSPSQFINLRDGAKDSKTGKPRGMRKDTARRIESAAGKPIGWLDIDHSASPDSPPAPPPRTASDAHGLVPPSQTDPEIQSPVLSGLSPAAREHVEHIAELSRQGELSDEDFASLLRLLERRKGPGDAERIRTAIKEKARNADPPAE